MSIILSDEAIEAVIKARLQYYIGNEPVVCAIWENIGVIEAIIEQYNGLKTLQEYVCNLEVTNHANR